MIAIPSDFPINNSDDTLVVLLHASSKTPASMRSVRNVIIHSLPSSAILCPKLPTSVFSFTDPEEIVKELARLIDQVWNPGQKIILIGHSIGALLARKLYVYAFGENCDAPFGPKTVDGNERTKVTKRKWAEHVDRIILLAGVNRGWTISHNVSTTNAILFRLGVLFGHLCTAFGKPPQLFYIRRGAPFITQLRIQWLSLIRKNDPKKLAKVIQLLGSVDDIVAPEDDLDMVTGTDFYYFDVPMSGHANVIDMDDPAVGWKRRKVLAHALKDTEEELKDRQVLPVDDDLLQQPDPEITDVVFVIHGIRDRGFWTHKIARKVKAIGEAKSPECRAEEAKPEDSSKKPRKFATETSSYGYFPMLPFILPWVRRSKVEWFMNQYTEDLVLYPEADFSFVGHSNGTYLLAKALEEYPSCHFANVVFAGSVVRTRYNWPQLIWEGRIKRVLNYVATADWVVALSTKGFQTLGFQDLGSAGFDGFVDGFANFENPSSARQISETPPACQIKYVVGTHSTALKEGHWDDIANFIVHGQLAESKPKEEDEKLFRGTQSILVALGGVFFLLIWMIIAVVVIGIAVWIWNYPQGAEWVKTLVLVLYAALVWTVVTQL